MLYLVKTSWQDDVSRQVDLRGLRFTLAKSVQYNKYSCTYGISGQDVLTRLCKSTNRLKRDEIQTCQEVHIATSILADILYLIKTCRRHVTSRQVDLTTTVHRNKSSCRYLLSSQDILMRSHKTTSRLKRGNIQTC